MGRRQPATLQLLPIELKIGDRISDATGLWEVIGRPLAAPNEKTVHVRVRRLGQPSSAVLLVWGAQERLSVKRA
jgi:hypothetical protein